MKHLVILSGAGISAESGIKTFRDTDGLWENYDIKDVASPMGWAKNPQLVLDFYNARRSDVAKAVPNLAHTLIAQLEAHYKVTVITQNIDDLHERGGATNVVHLHGQLTKMRSVANDGILYNYDKDIKLGDKDANGRQLRPHIVWFGEAVPMMDEAVKIMRTADICLIIGTSMQVYPAAGLIDYAHPMADVYIIDKEIPPIDMQLNYIPIQKPATQGMQELYDLLMAGKSPKNL
jgi:NAD-dependent deacetylase